jgi:hypothetical protein
MIVNLPPTIGLRSFSVQLYSSMRLISVTSLNLNVLRQHLK